MQHSKSHTIKNDPMVIIVCSDGSEQKVAAGRAEQRLKELNEFWSDREYRIKT